jgi:hypothetical protein
MIYIIQKSRRSSKRNIIKLNIEEAKDYLYNIDSRSFRISEFIVYCGDSYEELESIIDYFSIDYLQETLDDIFIVFHVNEKVDIEQRLSGNHLLQINKKTIDKGTEKSTSYFIKDKQTYENDNKKSKDHQDFQSKIYSGIVIPDKREDIENEIKLLFLIYGAETETTIRTFLKDHNQSNISLLSIDEIKELYVRVKP